MKCQKCNQNSTVSNNNYSYCLGHFNEYFIGKIKKIIDKFKINKNSKIILAYSGGKDSSSILFCLEKLGFTKVTPIYLKLDFDFLAENTSKIEVLKNIKVLDINQTYKISAKKIKEKTNKSICTICSILKRYFLNKYAFENDYDFIITGHNMSDHISSAFANIKNSFFLGFTNLTPYLKEKNEYKLVAKLKPLFYLTDTETSLFCKLNNIFHINQNCQFSRNNIFKSSIKLIENSDYSTLEKMASTLIEFSKKVDNWSETQKIKTNVCKMCGYPTSSDVCSFCKLINKTFN